MNEFLQYLLNSAICLSTLYLLFRILMRKEAFFKLNRIVLLTIVICSMVIPKLIMPQFIQQSMQQPLEFQLPVFKEEVNNLLKIPVTDKTVLKAETNRSSYFSIQEMLAYSYLIGLLIAFLILVYGLISIFRLYRMAKVIRMDGFRLLIVEKEIAAFSFGHLVFISQRDYEDHQQVILAHEREHIRFGHFYDLFFLEVIKIIFWFNPFIYWLIRDIKDVHEFQADDHTLTKGIDATKYQLLIIQKSVGQQRFALANSFNHCQIKNRIVMMNKQKSGKAWHWKVAAFLPVLALLLMAFGKTGEKSSSVNQFTPLSNQQPDKVAASFTIGKEAFLKGNKFSQLNDSLLKMQKKGAIDYKDSVAVRDSMQYWYQRAYSSFDIVTNLSPDYAGGFLWKGRMANYLDLKAEKTEAKEAYEKALTILGRDVNKNKRSIIECYKYLAWYNFNNSERVSKSDKQQSDQYKNAAKDYYLKISALDPNDNQARIIIEKLSKK